MGHATMDRVSVDAQDAGRWQRFAFLTVYLVALALVLVDFSDG